MPTYDYRCEACGHQFEAFQSMTAAHLRKCPHCQKLKLKRLIGIGAGIIFKGSGFYETDYRSESYKKAAQADKEPSKDASASKPESQSDSTPASSSAEAKLDASTSAKPEVASPASSNSGAKSDASPAKTSSGRTQGGTSAGTAKSKKKKANS